MKIVSDFIKVSIPYSLLYESDLSFFENIPPCQTRALFKLSFEKISFGGLFAFTGVFYTKSLCQLLDSALLS